MSYRTKMWMTELDDYKGLFADGGEFDIPAMFNVGLAYKARPNVTLALDYQHIFYDEIDALSNSNDKDLTPCFVPGPKPEFCLGGKDGLGFGWDSMDIVKLGVKYDQSAKLSLMGGVSYNTEFSSGRQALFNVLAPATVRWHLTLGASYRYSQTSEFKFAFSYMPEEELSGTSPSITQTQSGSIFMSRWSSRSATRITSNPTSATQPEKRRNLLNFGCLKSKVFTTTSIWLCVGAYGGTLASRSLAGVDQAILSFNC